jgi:hypothetical protein
LCCKSDSVLPICNNDGDCDAGETDVNCPNDCPLIDCTSDDFDGDGWNATAICNNNVLVDCNDTNSTIYPGATEFCGDDADNNCNGKEDCLDSACTSSSLCPTCPVVYTFDCLDAEGATAECVVNNCWEIDLMTGDNSTKKQYCESCPNQASGECIWVDDFVGCRKKGSIDGCYQVILEEQECGVDDATHTLRYNWYNTSTKSYEAACDNGEGCSPVNGCVISLPCPSLLKLPFFGVWQWVWAIMLIAITYLVYNSREKK